MIAPLTERALSDVVFLVEGTANLGAYIENLKLNYIIPTLEYVIILFIIINEKKNYFVILFLSSGTLVVLLSRIETMDLIMITIVLFLL